METGIHDHIDHQVLDISQGQLEIFSNVVTMEQPGLMTGKHFHEYYEVVYLLDGQTTCTVDGVTTTMIPESTVIIFPNRIHSFDNVHPDGSTHLALLFSPSILNIDNSQTSRSHYLEMFSGARGCAASYLTPPYAGQREMRSLLSRIYTEYTVQDVGFEFQLRGLVYQLLGYIQQNGEDVLQPSAQNNRYGEIKELCRFIEENCSQNFTLASIAQSMNYSKEHFSRLFKEVVGENFKDFVDYVKINEAERMLLYKKCTVQEAAISVGYSNPYSFSRAFKRIKGYSPSLAGSPLKNA